jgi:hypothetical protein
MGAPHQLDTLMSHVIVFLLGVGIGYVIGRIHEWWRTDLPYDA